MIIIYQEGKITRKNNKPIGKKNEWENGKEKGKRTRKKKRVYHLIVSAWQQQQKHRPLCGGIRSTTAASTELFFPQS